MLVFLVLSGFRSRLCRSFWEKGSYLQINHKYPTSKSARSNRTVGGRGRGLSYKNKLLLWYQNRRRSLSFSGSWRRRRRAKWTYLHAGLAERVGSGQNPGFYHSLGLVLTQHPAGTQDCQNEGFIKKCRT